MKGRFEIFQFDPGEYRFRLRAFDDQTIMASEPYCSKSGCINGIELVRKKAAFLGNYELKQTAAGKFMFLLRASDESHMVASVLYETEADRENGIASVMQYAPAAILQDTTDQL